MTLQRMCHNCLYSLEGHASPAVCPECGTEEIPQDRDRAFRSLRSLRVRFLCQFPRHLSNNLWTLCLFPEYKAAARRSITSVVIGISVLLVALVFCPHLWSFGRPTHNDNWSERTWWYDNEGDEQYSSRVDCHISQEALVSNVRGRHGEEVVFFYMASFPQRKLQQMSRAMLYDAIMPPPGWWDSVAQGFRMMVRFWWGPAAVVGMLGWLVVLSTSPFPGPRRALRVMAILLASLLPFLITAIAAVVAKCAYIAWWCNLDVVHLLVGINMATVSWPEYVYLRYALKSHVSRRRQVVLISGAMGIGLWSLAPVVGFVTGGTYRWF